MDMKGTEPVDDRVSNHCDYDLGESVLGQLR